MTAGSASKSFGGLKVRLPLAFPGECIGLLGGSFNPAHDGHRQITLAAIKRLGLDRVWWLVTPGNPLKGNANLAPLGTRVRRARATACDRRIVVTDLEAGLPSTYTVDTIAFIARRLPATRFVWLMGADNLVQIHHWRDWERIFGLVAIAVLDRPGWRLKGVASKAAGRFRGSCVPELRSRTLASRAAPAWTFLTLPLSPLSSSEIRQRAQRVKRH